MKIKAKKMWAIVNRKNPKLDGYMLYDNKKGIILEPEERFVRVEIKVVEK